LQRTQLLKSRALIISLSLLFALLLITLHLYRTPSYSMDLIGYMGNALLCRTQNVKELHQLVYREVSTWPNAKQVMGEVSSADPSRTHPAGLACKIPVTSPKFPPCFAIRPLYNDALYVLSPLGLSRGALLMSVVSYLFLGWLLFAWTGNALCSLAVMLAPPIVLVGRTTASDAPSILCALAALYLIFKADRLFPGLLLLLVSVFVRTDNVMLVAAVLLALLWLKKFTLSECLVLGILAVASVLFIHHFAGDYGLAMLYYRNFGALQSLPAKSRSTCRSRNIWQTSASDSRRRWMGF
jgi:hypothetical protein